MLRRFLYTPTGRVRVRRMIGVLVVTIGLAIFGSFLLALTPILGGHEGLQTLWVLFCVFLLKFPLVSLLWWFIVRNKEWPVRPPRWSEEEVREILAYLVAEADRSLALSDAPERLAYLQREAWNVADRAEGAVKVDAVDVALHIDQLRARRPQRRR
ncbi:MAG: hypothetical protein K2X91_07140 [Thermoleophilia bacterium]|nr:hypothetical protein [Thermoleophilia bacterium]